MALRMIVKEKNDDTLHKASRPVEKFDMRLHLLLDDMADTMYEADGVGLAAVQVGVLRRCFIVDVGEGITEYINPEILKREGEQDGLEGCLSSPGEYGMVIRPNSVTIKAQDRHGNWFTKDAKELEARALCHEYDHLDGHTFKELAYHMLSKKELEELEGDS